MDLFGGADDISSGSDGEDKPPTPGQPIVSTPETSLEVICIPLSSYSLLSIKPEQQDDILCRDLQCVS